MTERRQMTLLDTTISKMVYDAIQHDSNNTDRSLQQRAFRLGVSSIGHCRQYARLMMAETPWSDERDKTAAWVGTALGDRIENALKRLHPGWLFQYTVTFTIPSGGQLTGHLDVAIPASEATEETPQGVWDLKSKAELDTVRRYGQTMQQKFQLHMYASGLIDQGILDPSKPIILSNVFYDRSAKGGHVAKPYVITTEYDPAVIAEIDEWINDVKYAFLNNEDASRDKPREFCWEYCEYATACRGDDTDVEGLLEDPVVLATIEEYVRGAEMEAEGKRLKNRVKGNLLGVQGSTGTHTVRWVHINESVRPASHVDAYQRLDVRPVPKPRPKKGS